MHEYKVVPAPSRAPKVRGLKTTAERFAHALAEAINAEAAGGWQFLRTETLPCEERGALGRSRSTTQVVMVFSRALGQARPDAGAALAAAQEHYAPAPYRAAPEPAWDAPAAPAAAAPVAAAPVAPAPVASAPAAPAGTRREPLFRAGTLLRGDAGPRPEPALRPRPPSAES